MENGSYVLVEKSSVRKSRLERPWLISQQEGVSAESFEAVLCIGDTQIDTAWSTVSMGGKVTFTWTAWDMPPWCDGKRNVAGMADTV